MVDLAGHRLLRDGQALPVKPKAFELLAYLLRHAGQVISRDQLLEHVWGYDYAGETRTVDVHVHWLRSVLEDDPGDPAVPPDGARRRLRGAPAGRLTAPPGRAGSRDRRSLRASHRPFTPPSCGVAIVATVDTDRTPVTTPTAIPLRRLRATAWALSRIAA